MSDPGQHVFEFDRETRRMVCAKCGGVMNECPELCMGRKETNEESTQEGRSRT